MEAIEQIIQGAGGLELYTWRAQVENPRGAAILLHGYGEHSGRYQGPVSMLNGLGVSCYLMDLRGHGRSQGQRGAVTAWHEYLDDLAMFLDQVSAWHGEEPQVLLGHSMGGLVATSFVLERSHPFKRLILSSPMFAVGKDVSPAKQALGRLLSRLLPKLSLPTEIQPEQLSHDPQVGQDYMADPLVHRKANTRWFSEALAAQERCQQGAPSLPVESLLVIYGTGDALVDPDGTSAFCQRLTLDDATCRPYDGLYHELFNETDKERVLAETRGWLEERL